MSDAQKQYPIPQIERAISEALNPRGMSTHSGKVTLDVSWVQRLLILADPTLRQEIENAAQKIAYKDALEQAAKVCDEYAKSRVTGAMVCAAAIRAKKECGK